MAKRVHRKLSDKEIQAAKKKPGRHSDGGNLYLQVSKAGAASWVVVYKLPHLPKQRWLGLGPLEHVDARTAREKAAEARKLIFKGQDPMEVMGVREGAAAKAKPAKVRTFKTVAEDAIESYEAGWKPGTAAQWRLALKTHVYPSLGGTPVGDVTTDDVFETLKPIWMAKPVMASQVRVMVEKVLDFAKVRELRSGENPARWRANLDHLMAKQPKGKHNPALPYERVGSFMAELRGREGSPARAMELLILTVCRTGEVLGARWDEIDLDQKVWMIPAERMKMKKGHRVPLSDAAIKLLEAMPKEKDVPYVFVSPAKRDQLLRRADRTAPRGGTPYAYAFAKMVPARPVMAQAISYVAAHAF